MYAVPIAMVSVALLTGTFALLQRWIEKRYNSAKDAVEKNSVEVEDMTKVVQGFKDLAESYRTTIKEKDDRIRELEAKVSQQEGNK